MKTLEVNDSITKTDVNENFSWEQLNKYLEIQYETRSILNRKVNPSDYETVLKFIEKSDDENGKYLCSLWLDKMENKNEGTVGKEVENATSDRILRRRSPINKTSTSIQDDVVLPNDVNALPIDYNALDIPSLLKDDTTYHHLKINYNELENFFRVADENTINENIYDMLCLHASNCLYVESAK